MLAPEDLNYVNLEDEPTKLVMNRLRIQKFLSQDSHSMAGQIVFNKKQGVSGESTNINTATAQKHSKDFRLN